MRALWTQLRRLLGLPTRSVAGAGRAADGVSRPRASERRAHSASAGAAGDTANASLGAAGERAAEAHLRAGGLRVLARNWRNPADAREELDLVCADGETLVFVEVKARAAGARVSGYHAVDRRKKAVLLRACRAYLARLRPPARHYRFDIVEVAHAPSAEQAAALAAMRLDPTLASMRDGRQVWHYRDVPLFPDRSPGHRHGEHR